MNNKLNNMLNDFLANANIKDENELNEKLQEFIANYNTGEIEYENTLLDDAYDLLEKAENAKTKNQAIKLAKQAYELCQDCLDAILFQVTLEDNALKREKLLDEGLALEKERLTSEKFFVKDNIGSFYGIFETRPYIRGLCVKATNFAIEGKISQARDVCKEILRLDKNDNLGVRYLLMAIYAFLEEEKEMFKLYNKYPEDCLEMLFPQLALYYKLGDNKNAKEVLTRINKANPHFVKFFKGTIKENANVPDGYFSKGDVSEVLMFVERYNFLINTIPNIDEFILEYSE